MEKLTRLLPIPAWAEEDRPREKFMDKGRESLSDAELLAILIGTGSADDSAVELARQLLHAAENNLQELARKTIYDLMAVKGIGKAKAVTIQASFELARRYRKAQIPPRFSFKNSQDVFEYLQPMLADKSHEVFFVMFLNRANQLIRSESISSGGKSGTVVDARMIFSRAIQLECSGIILAHNHPSGNLKPSEADIRLTKKLREAALLLEMQILDHVIIGDNQYYSFSDAGV